MNIPSPRGTKRARIEIVPLIDIIFFLLATFVMVSLSMIKNAGINVNLPVAATGKEQDRGSHTAISITAGDEIFFNKEAVTLEELVSRLASLKQRETEPRVFINGDAAASFGTAVRVLDETRKLGFTKVSIETQPTKPANGG